MPKKHHPMSQAKAGDVFAIGIDSTAWGVVRFYRGLQMCVPRYFLTAPCLPVVDWLAERQRSWHFFSFAPDDDMAESMHLGVIPFNNLEEEWGPPVFDPPDVIQNCYVIHRLGGLVKTKNPDDVKGMDRSVIITPTKLAAFLGERMVSGGLKHIK